VRASEDDVTNVDPVMGVVDIVSVTLVDDVISTSRDVTTGALDR